MSTPRERLAAMLSEHEGYKRFVYDDSTGKPIVPGSRVKGFPTVGYGLELSRRGLTPRQAAWLRDDILDEVEHALSTRLPCYSRLTDARRMALLSMAYQCGVDGLLGFVKMIAHLEQGSYLSARTELLTSAWAGQTQAARVEAIAEMIGEGSWPEVAA